MGGNMANKLAVSCECGMEMRAPKEEEAALIASVKHHVKTRHNQPEPKDAEIRKMMKLM
jgi:predicted small metal-binding protein